MMIVILALLGMSSRRSSNRFAPSSAKMNVTPVTLPPGLLRLFTRPSLTGSPPAVNTIGMVAVAALAASPDASPYYCFSIHGPTRAVARTNDGLPGGARGQCCSRSRCSLQVVRAIYAVDLATLRVAEGL